MALQELCLERIGESFDRFCSAYCTTDNDDLRLRFQFLQKVYPSRLVSLLNEDMSPKNYYADLVFSKYVKSVDTGWLLPFSSKTIFDTFARIGPSLENVLFNADATEFFEEECTFAGANLNYMQWKSIIIYLPNVKAITYECCNNANLKCIAKYCPKLETLDVKLSHKITDDGLKYFYQKEQGKVPCPLLKEIFLESASFRNETIKHLLKNLPLLEKIDSGVPFALYDMHMYDLGSLDKVERYNLKHLNLLSSVYWAETSRFDDTLEICITLCPNLKSFSCSLFKLEHSSWCSKLPDVEDLNLDCVNPTPINVNDVLKKKGGKLRSLILRNCCMSLSVLGQYCYHLNELTLNIVKMECNEDDSIPMFYNLKALTILNVDSSNPVYCKAVCLILASSPNLENLSFKKFSSFSSGIKTEILKCCEQCPLKLIDFRGSSVEVPFIKDILVTCSTLEVFHLDARYTGTEQTDICRTPWFMPSSPELVFSDESSDNFSYSDIEEDLPTYLDGSD